MDLVTVHHKKVSHNRNAKRDQCCHWSLETQHTFVSTLLSLTDVHGRLEEIQNLLGQGGIGQGPSCVKEKS